jgi:hypothetical protein
VETPGDSQEMTESPDAISLPFPVLEETISASQEVAESPDTITPPIPVLEETISASQEVAESPDIILPSLHGIEGTSGDSQEASGSLDTLSPPEVPIIVESAPVNEEESESQDTVTLVPAFEEIPGAPEADSGEQKRVSVSLLAAVKSLISPKERTGLPDSVLTPLPGLEETRVAALEMTGSPFPLLPPEVPEIVASPYTQEEKAEPILPHETSTIEEKPGASQEDTGYPDLPNSPDPVTVESTAVLGQDSQIAEQVSFEAGNGDESVQQPSPGENPPSPGSPPPSAGPGSRLLTFIAVAAIILIILGIAGVVVFYPQNLTASRVEPTPLPTQTIQQTLQPTLVIPLPTAVIIPTTGVWVRVDYPRSYYGLVGNSGSMRGVTGSGDQVYKIYESEGIVQAQIQKTDNTGDTLTVEIYRDGKVIGNRSVSIPRGSVELLIDAKTGNPPAMTPVVTPSSNQTGSNVGRIMYF